VKDELPTSVAPATVNVEAEVELRRLTTGELRDLLAHGPSAALVPVGSVEPHGPHLPLGTDTTLGEESARRAAIVLRAHGIGAVVAPAVAYGASPRASINLILAARALAFVRGRFDYAFANGSDGSTRPALELVVLSYEALSDNVSGDDLLKKILERIPMPEVPLHERARFRRNA